MRRRALTGIAIAIGAGLGFLLVASNALLGAVMGAAAGLVIALLIQAFPRERDYPREMDDTYL